MISASFIRAFQRNYVLRKYVLSIFIVTERDDVGHGPYAYIMRGCERDLRYTVRAGIIRICRDLQNSEMLFYIITFMNRPS